MKYKLVIFDFDGTLADSFEWFLGVVGELAARHKFKTFARSELDELRGSSARTVLARLGVSRRGSTQGQRDRSPALTGRPASG